MVRKLSLAVLAVTLASVVSVGHGAAQGVRADSGLVTETVPVACDTSLASSVCSLTIVNESTACVSIECDINVVGGGCPSPSYVYSWTSITALSSAGTELYMNKLTVEDWYQAGCGVGSISRTPYCETRTPGWNCGVATTDDFYDPSASTQICGAACPTQGAEVDEMQDTMTLNGMVAGTGGTVQTDTTDLRIYTSQYGCTDYRDTTTGGDHGTNGGVTSGGAACSIS